MTARISVYDQALKRNPKHRDAAYAKAYMLFHELERDKEAVATLDKALRYYPDDIDIHRFRGRVLLRLAERNLASYEEALSEFEEVIRLSGGVRYGHPLSNWGDFAQRITILERLGRYKEARAAYYEAASLFPNRDYWSSYRKR